METSPNKKHVSASSRVLPIASIGSVWVLAGELALLIVIPLLAFMWAGIALDRYFITLPLFIIVALVLSFVTSTVIIARKIRRLQREEGQR